MVGVVVGGHVVDWNGWYIGMAQIQPIGILFGSKICTGGMLGWVEY